MYVIIKNISSSYNKKSLVNYKPVFADIYLSPTGIKLLHCFSNNFQIPLHFIFEFTSHYT